MSKLERSNKILWFKHDYTISLKKIYKWHCKEETSELTKWIKTKMKKGIRNCLKFKFCVYIRHTSFESTDNYKLKYSSGFSEQREMKDHFQLIRYKHLINLHKRYFCLAYFITNSNNEQIPDTRIGNSWPSTLPKLQTVTKRSKIIFKEL